MRSTYQGCWVVGSSRMINRVEQPGICWQACVGRRALRRVAWTDGCGGLGGNGGASEVCTSGVAFTERECLDRLK